MRAKCWVPTWGKRCHILSGGRRRSRNCIKTSLSDIATIDRIQWKLKQLGVYNDSNSATPTKYESGGSSCVGNGKSNDWRWEAQWDDGITWSVWDSDELNRRVKLKNLWGSRREVRCICCAGFWVCITAWENKVVGERETLVDFETGQHDFYFCTSEVKSQVSSRKLTVAQQQNESCSV